MLFAGTRSNSPGRLALAAISASALALCSTEMLSAGSRRLAGPRRLVVVAISAAAFFPGASCSSATGGNASGAARLLGLVPVPWFFDCSHHSEWSRFRERLTSFRERFHAETAWESPSLIAETQELLLEANNLGRRFEDSFTEYAGSWQVFHLCGAPSEVPQEMRDGFCFYGFVAVQWLGLFGNLHFGSVPGMAEWARNAHGFLNDASKFNSMHFLESSGWPIKLVEMAQGLSDAFQAAGGGPKPSQVAALPLPLRGTSIASQGAKKRPAHSRDPEVQTLRAVGISYHTALLREPLSLWLEVLSHRFRLETTVHVLDTTARTMEDVKRLHAHCSFLKGAWCASDERLLQLNEFFRSEVLDCHRGDHKTRHPFIRDTEAYYRRFVEVMGDEPSLHSADLLLCGEPVFFCKLLAFFGKPVVAYVSTPLSVYVRAEDRGRWYRDFREMALDERHTFAVTTPIFGEWIAYATGIDLPVIRPACLYTEATYWPVRDREVLLLRAVSLFWDSECVLNHFAQDVFKLLEAKAVEEGSSMPEASKGSLHFRESTSLTARERVGYTTFAEFLAVVLYPYAFSQFWFYEFYAMGVPLYMPASDTLPLFVYQDYASCPDFSGHLDGHLPHLVHPYSPFDANDWEAMKYWTSFTDYLILPHVETFDSVPQLVMKLERGDHRARSRMMMQVHRAHLGAAASFWLQALSRAADHRSRGTGSA